MRSYIPVPHLFSVPAVSCRYDQSVSHAGSPQAAAQLVEQAVCQRLQGQHHQQGAQEETVGGLQEGQKITFSLQLRIREKHTDTV